MIFYGVVSDERLIIIAEEDIGVAGMNIIIIIKIYLIVL
jgi:hypothetical protein